MKRRRETWRWKSELEALNKRYTALTKTSADLSVPDALLATKEFISELQDSTIDIDIPSSLQSALEDRIAEVAAELQTIESYRTTLQQNISTQFEDLKQYEYRLHAVFIHRGEIGGGHYWIFIFDFEHRVWRKYNDDHVSIIKDPKKDIFDNQGAGEGTPYYLVYVRAEQQKDLVDAVCRDVQEQFVEMVDNDDNGWTDYRAEDEMEGVRHVEHVAPRPLRPKPSAEASGQRVNSWDNAAIRPLDVSGRSTSWDDPKNQW